MTDGGDRRRTVRAAYDAIADDYATARDEDGGTALVDRVAGALPAGARVLDAGCGDGTAGAARVRDAGHEAVALDFSREQARRAAETVPGRVARGDLAALPLAADSVDAVLALYSVIHVPRDEHAAVFEEFRRVLRDGGRVLVTVGIDDWEGSNPDWLDTGVEMAWSFYGPERSADLLADAGFDVVETALVGSGTDDEDETHAFLLAEAT